MSRTSLTEERQRFCGAFLDTMDAGRTARRAGTVENSTELLQRADVQRFLARARESARQAVGPEDVVRRLCQIAFARPNDAIALACGQRPADAAELDLSAVAEFKWKEDAAEVKFFDPVRALQTLSTLLDHGDDALDGTAEAFFRALSDSAAAETGNGSGGDA